MTSKVGSRRRETKRRIPDGEYGPWVALAAAVVEQAILDVKRLQAEGVILSGGELVKEWPKSQTGNEQYDGKNRRFQGYRMHCEAQDLLHFLTGPGADEMLSLIGYKIDSERIRKELDI